MTAATDVARATAGVPAAPASILRSVVTTYSARFATLVAFLVLLPVVLQSVGADAYGLYALTVALGAIFQQDLGIGDATTRFIAVARPAGDLDRMRRTAAASAGFSLAAAVVMGAGVAVALVLAVAAADVPAPLDTTARILVALGVANVFLLLAMSPHRQVLAGIGRIDDVNLVLIGQAAMRIVLTLAVCALGWGIVAVAVVDVAATLALGGATLWLRRRRMPGLVVRLRDFRWDAFRELFSMSAQLLVIGLSAVVITQVGSVLTALLLPIAFATLFAAAQRMYLVVKEVTGSLATALLPIASLRHGEGAVGSQRELYLSGTGYANMLMTIVLVPAVLFMPTIMQAWIGADGAAAALVAQILILSLFANNNHLLALPVLTAQGRVRAFAVLHATWAVSGTVLAAILGATMGLPGIALGIALPVIALEPIYVWVVLRRIGATAREFLARCLARPLLPALPLAVVLVVATAATRPGFALAATLSAAWAVALAAVYVLFDPPARAAARRLVRPGRSAPTHEENSA
ncbi:lipopolysaccharide biosynthesis protein [Microbacterium rhizophilus]|uniref:lipopolysaccharide biosynthesis protein n=1 Tax=Microbacterium rhizophilus TaxID=3138934 RepID=UPI0031E9AA9D